MDISKQIKEIVDVLNKINKSIMKLLPNPIYDETPVGTIDGANKAFTLAHTPETGSLRIFLNGMYQTGGGEDYTLSGTIITFVNAPLTGSILRGFYYY